MPSNDFPAPTVAGNHEPVVSEDTTSHRVQERILATRVTLPVAYEPHGACVAWVESRGETCGKTTDFLLCPRHVQVAQRRLEKDRLEREARQAKHAATRAEMLPKWRARLERIDRRIAVLDPPVATTDRAAYGGEVHPSIVRSQRAALSDSKVAEMADLLRERDHLVRRIGVDL